MEINIIIIYLFYLYKTVSVFRRGQEFRLTPENPEKNPRTTEENQPNSTTSRSYDEESSSPASEVEEVPDYELEVEEFESLSDGHVSSANRRKILLVHRRLHRMMMNLYCRMGSKLYGKKRKGKVNVNSLQETLDEEIPITD